MDTSKKGQSVIEYSLIAILVMGGILVSGPYVIRAINSHFKLVDDAVKDSFSEKIKQAPVTTDDIPINGVCSGLEDKACGNGKDCVQNAMRQQVTCDPLGYETTYGTRTLSPQPPGADVWYGTPNAAGSLFFQHCKWDNACCKDLGATGVCGSGSAAGPDDALVPPAGCSVGHMVMKQICGNNPASYYCSKDLHSACAGKCKNKLDPHATACPLSPPQAGKSYTYVTGLSKCTTTVCQGACDGARGWIPNPAKTACQCKPPAWEKNGKCVQCPPGTVLWNTRCFSEAWFQTDSSKSCAQVCADAGWVKTYFPFSKKGSSHITKLYCLSGEQKLNVSRGARWDQIKYLYGCWGCGSASCGCIDAETNTVTDSGSGTHYCYSDSQETDDDGTDKLVGCYCKNTQAGVPSCPWNSGNGCAPVPL